MGPLVDTAGLRDLLAADPSATVLDVRYRLGGPPGAPEHEAGHVPGAAYVDLPTALSGPPGAPVDDGGRHPLPGTEGFLAAMRAAGVRGDRTVVVYDDWSGHAAARAWWLLRHHGHPDVRVLDGGWSAWVADGGAVETGPVDVEPGDLDGSPGAMPVVGPDDLDLVEVLLDARAPERYRGEVEPVDPVAGHVPGAVNVPTSANLTPEGRFRPVEELREVYAAAGAVPGAEVAAYCGSGVTACLDVLALKLVGVRAALYPGSWSGWTSDRSRGIEVGV